MALASAAFAQTHRVDAPEKVTRAVGVYEWTGDLAKPNAARLVPVTVFIEGQMQDGGTYYARPVPLALVNGNIYSLEKAGVAQGNLTLDYARHLVPAAGPAADNNDIGWFGYGDYTPLRQEKKAAPLRASAANPEIVGSKDKDADRPTFSKRSADDKKGSNNRKTDDQSSVTPATSPTDEDDERPHMSKAPAKSSPPPDPSDTPATTTASNTPPVNPRHPDADPEDDSNRPTLRRRSPKQAEEDRKKKDESGVRAINGSLNDDPDRPSMKRGKTGGVGTAVAQLSGVPVDLHQMVAVSDAATREPHPFARSWESPSEQAEMLAKMQQMAQQQLADYDRTNAAAAPAPAAPVKTRPGTAAARARRPAAKPEAATAPVAAVMSSEEIHAYTLSYGALPTFVYTAISPSVRQTAGPALPERYVTVVAQRLPSGEMQVALATVTDADHLDRTPWFRLIDAVDPDWEHRASLLFELRGHSGRQFGLYRILTAKAEQTFITNPTE